MKKLLTFVSAITAGAIGTAAADVSVSGSGNFYFSSASGDKTVAAQENSMSVGGGTVAFAMTTETTNGIAVSAGGSITRDTDDVATGATEAGAVAGGMNSLTFVMDGMTVSVGDIDGAGSGTGEGGDVATFASSHAGVHATAGVASASDSAMDSLADGQGINISTSMGVAAVDLTFVSKVDSGANSYAANATTTGMSNAYAINVGFDVAGAAVNVAAGGAQAKATSAKNNTAMGIEAAYPVSDALTLTVGGSNGTIAGKDEDNAFITAAYTMDADTTLKIGVASGDSTGASAGTVDSATATTINVTRSLGGGVSVFAEYADINFSDNGVNSGATAVSVGTSVSF
jgi:trimeric autotransporter adhesin